MKPYLLIGLLLSPLAHAFTPWQGQWWNPNEAGSGYNIDVQNGILVITIYSYKTTGDSEWYVASAPLSSNGKVFSGSLEKYRNGQCITCSYAGGPTSGGSDGSFSITFSDEMNATLQLPGRSTPIVPYRFGISAAPQQYFGEWVFTYDILSTWADRFNFTQVIPGTSTGVGGMAYDPVKYAACELQGGAGVTAGYTLCVDLTSSGARQNAYIWKYGIDQTYEGSWVSTSSTMYSMKGLRTKWANGQSKAAKHQGYEEDSAFREAAKNTEEQRVTRDLNGKSANLEIEARIEDLATKLRAAVAAKRQ